jgi:hypothetical protein
MITIMEGVARETATKIMKSGEAGDKPASFLIA